MKRRVPRGPRHSLTLRAIKGQPIYRPKKGKLPTGLSGTLRMHLEPRPSYTMSPPPPKLRRRGNPLEDLAAWFRLGNKGR